MHQYSDWFEDFTLQNLLLLEICTHEMGEKLAHKHSEIIKGVND